MSKESVFGKCFKVRTGFSFNVELNHTTYKKKQIIELNSGDIFKFGVEGVTFFNLDGIDKFYLHKWLNFHWWEIERKSNLNSEIVFPKYECVFEEVTIQHKRNVSIDGLLD